MSGTGEEFSSNCIAQTAKQAIKVVAWNVMSVQSTEYLYIVEDMMNHYRYKKGVRTNLIPQLKDWFPNEDLYSYMMDLCALKKYLWIKKT